MLLRYNSELGTVTCPGTFPEGGETCAPATTRSRPLSASPAPRCLATPPPLTQSSNEADSTERPRASSDQLGNEHREVIR